jgi:hypothetical protein
VSDYTTTPRLGLKKPTEGADDDLWGGHLNGNADILDNVLPLTGGTLTGPLTVSRYEIIDGGAAGPAQLFLDTVVGQEHLIVARSGGNARWAIRPGGPSAESGGNTGANFIITRHDDAGVALDNPLLITRATGVVAFSATPTAPTVAPGTATTQLATTEFVTAAVAGSAPGVNSFNTRTGAVVLTSGDVSGASGLLTTGGAMSGGLNFGSTAMGSVGDTSRHLSLYGGNATSGTFGFNVTGGRINYSVPLAAHSHSFNVAGVEEVRITNTGINLLNTGWVSGLLAPTAADHAATKAYVDTTVTAAVAPALNNVGRNLLHNPLFAVAQRGAGPFTVNSAYTLDRWQNITTDAMSVVQGAPGDVVRTQIGDEACSTSMSNTFTGGTGGAASFCTIMQKMENVRRLAGKTVTVSFYAVAGSAGLKLGVSLDQDFGTGGAGSPSAPVNGTGQAVTLAGTWARYSLTFTVPSIAGKTLSTTPGSDRTILILWYSAGANSNSRSGSIGIQSGAIEVWGVQLEIGSAATPLEKPDPQQDLAKCQRFYQVGQVVAGGYSAATISAQATVSLPVTMRALPTVAVPSNVDLALTSPTQSPLNGNSALLFGGVTPSGASGWGINRTFTASADL